MFEQKRETFSLRHEYRAKTMRPLERRKRKKSKSIRWKIDAFTNLLISTLTK